MYRDNSLIPSEAIRLAALGSLVGPPRRYADIAVEVRNFIGRLVGPSLDLLGGSIELLRFEGLIEPVDGAGMTDNAVMRLTAAGHAELRQLLTASLRPQVNDMNRLVMALKLRFLPLLDRDARLAQAETMAEAFRGEIARLADLKSHSSGQEGLLAPWLELEIAQAQARLDWCRRVVAEAENVVS